VKAVDRAFHEIVEAEWWQSGFAPDAEDGAIAGLIAIEDHEVPAHSRVDLLIAKHATQVDDKLLRALARMFASSQDPAREQVPNGQSIQDYLREQYAAALDEDDDGDGDPSAYLDLMEAQAAAAPWFRANPDPDVVIEQAASPPPPPPPPKRLVVDSTGHHVELGAHRLNEHTISAIHIRTIRAHAETLCEQLVVRACDDALGPPIDPFVRALQLRRRLASLYNAWFLEGQRSRGSWSARALRQIALAAGQFFHEPDHAPIADGRSVVMHDPVAEAQQLLRDVKPDEVTMDDDEDLRLVQTAQRYDLVSVRAMGRLFFGALEWRLAQLQRELGPAEPGQL
jgi:hypothetical protein